MSTLGSFRLLPATTKRDASDATDGAPRLLSYRAIALTALTIALVIASIGSLLAVADALWWAVMPAILALALPRLSRTALPANGWMLGYQPGDEVAH